MSLEVRQATADDYQKISRFIHDAYQELAQFKAYNRWRWQFLDNPSQDSDNGRPSVWIAVQDDRIVGQIAVQRCGLRAGAKSFAAGWIVDVMVLPEFRGLGLGHRLYEAASESNLVLVTLTMAPATRQMAERLGAISLPAVSEWFRPEAPRGRDVAQYLVWRGADKQMWQAAAKLFNALGGSHAVAAAARAYVGLRNRFSLRVAGDIYLFNSVERFSPRLDSVWKSVEDHFSGVPRTAAHLNWRFVDCPQLRYERFEVARAGKLVGYLVLRRCEEFELRTGILVDALALDDEEGVWDALITYANHLFSSGVAGIEAAFSTYGAIRALKRAGYFPTKVHRPTIVCRDKAKLAQLSQSLNWFFNKGDHDWDQFHLAEQRHFNQRRATGRSSN